MCRDGGVGFVIEQANSFGRTEVFAYGLSPILLQIDSFGVEIVEFRFYCFGGEASSFAVGYVFVGNELFELFVIVGLLFEVSDI